VRYLHYLTLGSFILFGAAACQSGSPSANPADDDDATTSGSGGNSGGAGVGAGQSNGVGGSASSAVVINELMFDPNAVADELGEWLELYNPGDSAIDLTGWTLRDESSNVHVIDDAVSIAPGQYLVLGRNGSVNNGDYEADYVYGEDFKLSNGGDAVILEDHDGKQIDSVAYDVVDPWPTPSHGVSFELSDPMFDNSAGASWQLAVLAYGDGDRGTPGAANGGEVNTGFTIDDDVVSWHNPSLQASMHFAPLDDLESQVLEQLATATSHVRLAFFNVRLPAVRDLLAQQVDSGLDVHVVLDKKQQDETYNTMGEDLTALGVPVTLVENSSATDATMHHKFAIIDGELIMTGSANYSYTALNISDEDLLTMRNPDLADRYLEEFDELLVGGNDDSAAYPGNPPMQVWMGPEDSLRNIVTAEIDAAQSTAFVAMFDMNLTDVIDALLDAKERGVTVAVVLDQVQADEEDADADETLAAAGIPVLLAHNTTSNYAEMHSKFLVVDHQRVVTGSYNWTNLGSFYNDESIVVIDDAQLAARTEGKFADLITAYGGSASAMGLTTGMQEVSFSLGNVTLDNGVFITIESIGDGPFSQPEQLSGTELTASIAAGTRITYRYKVNDSSGPLLQEAATHSFTVPFSSGPFTVQDAFIK